MQSIVEYKEQLCISFINIRKHRQHKQMQFVSSLLADCSVFAASIKTVKYEYEGVEDLLPLHSSGCSSCGSIEVMSPAFFRTKCGEWLQKVCTNIIKELQKIHTVTYHCYWLIVVCLGLWEHPWLGCVGAIDVGGRRQLCELAKFPSYFVVWDDTFKYIIHSTL